MISRIALLAVLCTVGSANKPHPLSDEFINHINAQKSTWRAGRNFDENTPLANIKSLMGSLKNGPKLPFVQHKALNLPESFDSRENWPECSEIISNIRDQSTCGSCWAFAAVGAMSDRICIQSEGKIKVSLSAEDLLSCCDSCGFGCNGGYPASAWLHYKNNGIVSGGGYNTTTGCKSYSFPECDHHVEGPYGPCGDIKPTPKCKKECDAGSNKSYNEDLYYASDVFSVGPHEEQIRSQILEQGPVEAQFDVYEDFLNYKSGVYQHISGEAVGAHDVRIIGWGVEDGVPYWLVANSWNEGWGDKGYFKFLRGSNHLGFEGQIVAGSPKI